MHVPDDVKVSYLTTPIVYLVRSESQCARKLQDQKANSLCIFYKSSTISTDDVKELFEELQHEKVIRIKSIPVDFTVNCPVCWNKKRAQRGIELRTSRTQSENHTTRPQGRCLTPFHLRYESSIRQGKTDLTGNRSRSSPHPKRKTDHSTRIQAC